MKTAISIPSYKHRYTNLLNNLNKSNDAINKFDIFVFLSNNDDQIDQYNIYDNLNIVKTDCNTLGSKKQFIFDYLYNLGYEKTFLIDDDVLFKTDKIIDGYMLPSGKGHKRVHIDLVELCEECNKKMDELNVSFLTTVKFFALGFFHPGEIQLGKVCNLGQFGLFNIKKITEKGIKFEQDRYEHEDVDMVFKIKLNELGIGALMYYTFNVDSKSLTNSSFESIDESLMHINLYLKYRDGITLRVDKNNKLRIIIRWGKYSNFDNIPIKDDIYHNQLYKLCKDTILNKDIDKLKYFIKNKNL